VEALAAPETPPSPALEAPEAKEAPQATPLKIEDAERLESAPWWAKGLASLLAAATVAAKAAWGLARWCKAHLVHV